MVKKNRTTHEFFGRTTSRCRTLLCEKRTARAGFTLVELIVTVGIFALITTSLLVRNKTFNDQTFLQSAAYEVALSIREAQNYGINVRGQGGEFDKAYGVYFAQDSNKYILFLDDGDGLYTVESDTVLKTYTLGRGYTIQRLCTQDISGGEWCPDTESVIEGDVTILFKRPDPEAIIKNSLRIPYPSIAIELASPRGGRRLVIVRQTGQIAVAIPDETTP